MSDLERKYMGINHTTGEHNLGPVDYYAERQPRADSEGQEITEAELAEGLALMMTILQETNG